MNGGGIRKIFEEENGEATELLGSSHPQAASHQANGEADDDDVQIVDSTPAEDWNDSLKKNGRFKRQMEEGPSSPVAPPSSPNRNAAAAWTVSEVQSVGDDGGVAKDIQQEAPKPRRRPSIADWKPNGIEVTPKPTPVDGSDVEEVQVTSPQKPEAKVLENLCSSPPQRVSRRIVRKPNDRESRRLSQGTESVPLPSKRRSSMRSRPAESEDSVPVPVKDSSDVEFVSDVPKTPLLNIRSTARTARRRERAARANEHARSWGATNDSGHSPVPARRKSARLRDKPQSSKCKIMDELMGDDLHVDEEPVKKERVSDMIALDTDDEPAAGSGKGSLEPRDDIDGTKGDEAAVSPVRETDPANAGAGSPEAPEEPSYLLFHFPPSKRGSIGIMSEDLTRLRKHQYLNDSLIDFYCKYLEMDRKRKNAGSSCSTFFFNSFFFHRLRQSKPVDYAGVKRWTNSVDLFGIKFIFVPMCVSFHWSLIIAANMQNLCGLIDLDEGVAVERAEEMGVNRPKMVYMDSLEPKRGQAFCKSMIEYIASEWVHRRKEPPIDDEEERKEEVKSLCQKLVKVIQIQKPSVPVQTNEYDCGLYVLHNIALFLDESNGMQRAILKRGRGALTKREDLARASRRMKGWYAHADIQRLRDKIMHLIQNLHQLAQETEMEAIAPAVAEATSAKNSESPGADVDVNESVDVARAAGDGDDALNLNPVQSPSGLAALVAAAGPERFGIDVNAALGPDAGSAENADKEPPVPSAVVNGRLFDSEHEEVPGVIDSNPADDAIDLDGSSGKPNLDVLDAGQPMEMDNSFGPSLLENEANPVAHLPIGLLHPSHAPVVGQVEGAVAAPGDVMDESVEMEVVQGETQEETSHNMAVDTVAVDDSDQGQAMVH